MLPLHHFFRQLQRHGFPLGVDDYALLFDAMNGGYGLESREDLKKLCRMLWFKPGQSWELFEELFDRSFEREKAELQGEELPGIAEEVAKARQAAEQERKKEEQKRKAREKEREALQDLEEEAFEVSDERITLSIRSTSQRTSSLQGAPEAEIPAPDFLFRGGYRPMSERQMALSWRFLRHQGTRVSTEQLDVPATVDHIARHDRLLQPVFHQTYLNDARLWILIDCSSSMVAFQGLAETLAASVPGGRAACFYFRNVPSGYLYKDPAFTEGLAVEDLRRHHAHRKAALILISDAGAARGTYHPQRVIDTQQALEALRPLSTGIAWLNPVPQSRWTGASAEYIQRLLVPMFEANESGLFQAVNVLRKRKYFFPDE